MIRWTGGVAVGVLVVAMAVAVTGGAPAAPERGRIDQFIFHIPPSGTACTSTAASTSYSDVNTAVSAAADGNVVCVPGGSASWSTQLAITSKSITLKGAGAGTSAQCSSGGQTTYTCITNTLGSNNPVILWTAKATGSSPAGYTRLTGFTFLDSSGAGAGGDQDMNVLFKGDTDSVRVDHNRFIAEFRNGLMFQEYVRGVIDQNTFELKESLGHMLGLQHGQWLNVNGTGYNYGQGDKSWAVANTVGSANQLIAEDNTFTTALTGDQYFTNDNQGARATYRFNTFIDGVYSDHGTETGGRSRSARHVEIYDNTFTSSKTMASWIGIRGGGLIGFDNVLTGTAPSTSFVTMENYRSDDPSRQYYAWGGCHILTLSSLTRSGTTATGTASANTSIHSSGSYITVSGASDSNFNVVGAVATPSSATVFTYTVSNTGATSATGASVMSPFDGNTGASGYPCLDQPGRGSGTLYSGNGPGDTVISPLSDSAQAAEPIFIWNNTVNGTVNAGVSNAAVVQANRDFYNYTASFDGTVGVGRGVRSSRPATCTTGVVYWSTDGGTNWNTANGGGVDGGLDKCTSTNTWTNDFYVPYTYPHPLRNGT